MEDWLRSIGLGERVQAFRDERIELDQLGDLTDEDLRELGLTIGERKRFHKAVAQLLKGEAVPVPGPTPGPFIRPSPAVAEATMAERRPLTMMFIDLVNSSALAEQLDAEDLLEVIRSYREFCGAAIMRYGGHIARLVGDGILAYFCYPVATENDPERAVRAGMDIVRAIENLPTLCEDPLSVRIGVATGRVIVSDLFAGGEADKQSIIGSTPNLAARLQGFAPPNGIVIADETHERVCAIFECEDLGTRRMKGFEAPHRAWRVIRELPQNERQSQSGPGRLTQMYGRQNELRLLGRAWARAMTGRGTVLLVTGEAGIGKTRLVEDFITQHVGHESVSARLAGSWLHVDSAFRPVGRLLRASAGITPEDDEERSLERLSAILTCDDAERAEVLAIFAGLLGIETNDAPLHGMRPEQLRARTFAVILRQLLAAADDGPCCVVAEDLHWMDPSSIELLSQMAEAVRRRPVLLLMTAREEFDASWLQDHNPKLIKLERLQPDDVSAMIQDLMGSEPVPAPLAIQIANKTDGLPLFIEEFVRSLLQSGVPADPWTDLDATGVPASLHESLMSRLDRSGPAKQIAQNASVVGRTVRRDLLEAISDTPPRELEESLGTLVQSSILQRESPDLHAEIYAFSHALLRDAAYESLLRERRRVLHLRIARTLQEDDPEFVSQQPELVALHLTEAGEGEEAAPFWLEAARRSLARSALTEATRLLRRGLAAVEKGTGARANSLRVQLSGLLGPALIALKGPGAAETQALYGNAVSLCAQMPEEPSHFPVYWGWWRVSRDFHTMKRRGDALLVKAAQRKDPEFLLQAHHCGWASHYHVGDFRQSSEHAEAGLAIYASGDFRHHAHIFGNHDPKVCAHGELSLIHWMQGRPRTAMTHERHGLSWSQELGHLGSRVHAMDIALAHHVKRRDFEHVYHRAGELLDFTTDHGLDDHRAKGQIFRGWTVAMRGDADDGLKMLEEGFAAQKDIGTSEDFPIYVCLLADALMSAGQPDRALEELIRARAKFNEIGLRMWLPEVLRTTAEAALAADGNAVDSAARLLDAAARVAEEQLVPMLALRTAITRARLASRLGDETAALAGLTHAISAIEEPEECEEVAAAAALAADLSDRLGRAKQPIVEVK